MFAAQPRNEIITSQNNTPCSKAAKEHGSIYGCRNDLCDFRVIVIIEQTMCSF